MVTTATEPITCDQITATLVTLGQKQENYNLKSDKELGDTLESLTSKFTNEIFGLGIKFMVFQLLDKMWKEDQLCDDCIEIYKKSEIIFNNSSIKIQSRIKEAYEEVTKKMRIKNN